MRCRLRRSSLPRAPALPTACSALRRSCRRCRLRRWTAASQRQSCTTPRARPTTGRRASVGTRAGLLRSLVFPHLCRATSTMSSWFRSDARMQPRSSSPGTLLAVLQSPRSRVRSPVARAKGVAHYAPGAAPSAAPTPAAAALACAMEKIAALQPRELALDRRLCHALEAMPREARFAPAVLRVHRLARFGAHAGCDSQPTARD
jgi:hypothetical protein